MEEKNVEEIFSVAMHKQENDGKIVLIWYKDYELETQSHLLYIRG